jgi:superfamily II DNA or RNA helicase
MVLSPGAILSGPMWPEPVRVVSACATGARWQVETVGTRTLRYYPPRLIEASLLGVEIEVTQPSTARTFSGDARRFRLAAEAHRIRLAYEYDPHFAVSVCQIDPLPHQLEAVYGFILPQPRIRFMLADDPGAGKTIMAGLVLKELKFRGLAERTLVVTPANLRDQWRRELWEKFHETFQMVGREQVDGLFGRSVWEEFDQCITSVDFARQEEIRETLREVDWDLLIVDEAHKMAAYRYGDEARKTKRYRLGETLTAHATHVLFLTATPHKGDPDNFLFLLQLLEKDLFSSTDILRDASANNDNPNFLRRLKEDMRNFDETPIFPPRHVFTTRYTLSPAEKALYDAVTLYVMKHFQRAELQRNRNVGLALTVLQRRVASSIYAILRSLERRERRLREVHEEALSAERREQVPDDLEDLAEDERWRYEQEALERHTLARSLPELQKELEELRKLIQLARAAEGEGPERKLQELKKVFDQEGLPSSDEKLLIFTEHKDTLDYLSRRIREWGYSVCEIHGFMRLEDRIEAERDFRQRTQVMVATEAAGEGINLQFCRLMVNWDIPWNPNRLEQRMGRIHRYGQRYEVNIYNLVATDTREGQVLDTLFERLEEMREAMGDDRVFDVIGDLLEGVSLDQLFRDALAQRRTIDEICALIDARVNPQRIDRVRELTLESLATRYVDYSKVRQDSEIARERRLVPEYIERFFAEAYREVGGRAEQTREGLWRIPHVGLDIRQGFPRVTRRYGPILREYHRLAFDKDVARRKDAEFIGPGHPLFEAALEKVLTDFAPDLENGAAFFDPDAERPGFLWFVVASVADGEGLTAGKRLYVARESDGSFEFAHPAALLDVQPIAEPGAAGQVAADSQALLNWAIPQVADPYYEEVLARRRHDLEVKARYLTRSFDHLISESLVKIAGYQQRLLRGDKVELALDKEERQCTEWRARKDRRLAELERTRVLASEVPQVLGVAALLPLSDADQGLKRALRTDRDVEAAAMEVAKQYEQRQGRAVDDVSAQNLGFDLRSTDRQGRIRRIEVKGRAHSGPVVLTTNEWLQAHRFGGGYWLYIVVNVAARPELYLIQNPASWLRPKEQLEVRYVVDAESWQEVAKPA